MSTVYGLGIDGVDGLYTLFSLETGEYVVLAPTDDNEWAVAFSGTYAEAKMFIEQLVKPQQVH
jgi:hypothetical protein